MKLGFAKPAAGERYLIDRNSARRLARANDPELGLLDFQTRHGPNMTAGVAYCATYASTYLRVLSVKDEQVTESMRTQFASIVMPWLLSKTAHARTLGRWPQIVVVLDDAFLEVGCSIGGLFPSLDEIRGSQKKGTATFICSTSDQ